MDFSEHPKEGYLREPPILLDSFQSNQLLPSNKFHLQYVP